MKFLLTLIAFLTPAAALAAEQVQLSSDVFVERVKQDAQGKPKTTLEPPSMVTPGDKLVFVLSYKNGGTKPAADFVVTNPVPPAVAFAAAEGDGAEVSVDGGKSWGRLAALQVKQPDGSVRAAAPADVTHVRWSFARAIGAGEAGKISFRGTVK
jgi:uncharacterized repeat protein (TIGR01451 family)